MMLLIIYLFITGFFILGIIFAFGKKLSLIAGYNTSYAEKKSKI